MAIYKLYDRVMKYLLRRFPLMWDASMIPPYEYDSNDDWERELMEAGDRPFLQQEQSQRTLETKKDHDPEK